MGQPVDAEVIANALPGTWHLSATNLPMWLDGSRRSPEREYELLSQQPLAITDRLRFTDAKGASHTIEGTDRWAGEGFVWRGAGRLRLNRARWSIAALDDDVLVSHFERSRLTPAGTEVAIREGSRHPELRRLIATDLQRFGLSLEQFASLTWLDHVPAM
ncbi:hypothetical protein ACFPJ4_06540 [Lysinimonas soli]|uniref:Lipocalin-like domain-containing protein n=1 Tax=Lysinimonas soli TaxID=1074233 RepID=A0ABW0NPB4_9MICO